APVATVIMGLLLSRGGEGRANFGHTLEQPTSCTQRGELRSSRMDLPLQRTILSQLTYVNLTHDLRAPDTSFLRPDVVIDCTGVLQKRHVASSPPERRSRLNTSARSRCSRRGLTCSLICSPRTTGVPGKVAIGRGPA